MKFDDVLREIGEFGGYQRRIYALLLVSWIVTSPIMVLSVFVLASPDHRCQLPGYSNDTYSVQGNQHRKLIDLYIPKDKDGEYDECHVYHIDQSNLTTKNISRHPIKCSSWVYGYDLFDETFTSKNNWVCDEKYKISLTKTIFFAGVLIGSFLFGLISDTIGRRKTILIANVFQFGTVMALAWADSFVTFAILRFCTGVAVVGIFMTTYVTAMEWVGPSRRTFAGLIIALLGPTGQLYLILASYLARFWSWIIIIIAIPFIINTFIWWFIPESPRWLCGKGRKEEAAILLQKAARVNGTEFSPKTLDQITPEKKESGKVWLLFSDRRLGIRTCIIFYNWMVASMVFYGLALNTGMLYGNFYINFLINVLVEFPGHLLPLYMIDRFGRKRSHFVFMSVGGLSCLSTIFTVNYGGEDLQPLTTALAMLGKLFATAAFATIYVLSAELYPTVIRNVGMGSSSCWARVGGMISPFIANTADLVGGTTGTAIPLVIFGGACLLAAGLTLILPETLHQMLPETIEDGKNFNTKAYKERSKKYLQGELEISATKF